MKAMRRIYSSMVSLVNMFGVSLSRSVLMVVLIAVFEFTGISMLSAATITTTAQGGLWSEKTTWIGEVVPKKTDDVVITSVVTTGDYYYSSGLHEMKNLTIQTGGKIIREKERAGHCVLKVYGNLVNHGEIIDYKDFFDIHLYGNLENHGLMKPRLFYMVGAGQQITASKPIGCKTFNLNMTDDLLVAKSSITFHNCAVSSNSSGSKKLFMGSHILKLSADSITSDGYYNDVRSATVMNVPVVFTETGTIICDRSIIAKDITGNLRLQSSTYAFFRSITIEGDLSIPEGTKISSESNLRHLTVRGDFINSGIINRDTVQASNRKLSPRSAYINIHGNAYNYGSTGISTIRQYTNGETVEILGSYDNNVQFQQAEGSEKPGGRVVINDEVRISGKLDVYAILEISESGVLHLLNRTMSSPIYVRAGEGDVVNNGSLYRFHRVNNSWSYRNFTGQSGTFVDYELRAWDGSVDGVEVEVHNDVFPGLPGSSKRWWRLTPVGEGEVEYYTVKFYYDEALLNGQKEENLKLFQSVDDGETWEVVSVREYAVLDTVENFISIGVWNKNESMLSDFGIFVISGGDGSVPVESSIKVDLVGRSDVRIGAPNPFTVHVYNITDFPTSPVMLAMSVTDDIRFKEVHLPYNDGVEVLPIDSISDPDDLTQVFFIPYLDPNEHYSFDVIVYGIPEGMKSASNEGVTITLGGFFGDKAKDGAVGYIVDEIGKAAELNAQERAEYDRGLGRTVNQLKSEKKQYGRTVSTLRSVTKDVVGKIAESNPITNVLFKVGDAVESVSKIKDSLRRRLFHWFYKEVGLYGVEEKVASGKQIKGELVSSWDPNEIVGPAGYGENNFISSTPVMNYTIMFENLKEATAPAYRVQIIDTLSAVFNAETVQFLETSHSGTGYTWKMERDGNVLKWDIEGIELPPNVTPPEGEGFVRFSVELAGGLPSGTVIENRATIIFDMNPPITTNTWVNVLDFDAPETVMNAPEYVPGAAVVTVSCSSTDHDGAGVGMYEFFVSIDDAPFVSLGQTTESSIHYSISDTTKNHFRFYALVTDNVYNAEESIPAYAAFQSTLVSSPVLDNSVRTVNIYPNPANALVYVGLFAEQPARMEIAIHSVNGTLLKKVKTEVVVAGQQRIPLDLSAYRPGIYFINVTLEGESSVFKVVKRP